MSWVAPSHKLASTSLTEMGRAASFARPEAPTAKSETGPISRRTEATTRSIRIVPGHSSMQTAQKSNNFVILDGCKRFFLLSATPETITTEEGKGSTWRTNGCWVVDMRECAGRQSNPFAWRKQVAQTHFYQEYRDALVIQARCRTEASIRRRLSTRSTISPLP